MAPHGGKPRPPSSITMMRRGRTAQALTYARNHVGAELPANAHALPALQDAAVTVRKRAAAGSSVASAIDGMSHSLELLGEHLCADPAVVMAHMNLLQQIDHIAQSQTSIADIIAAEDPIAVCGQASLDHLKRHAA